MQCASHWNQQTPLQTIGILTNQMEVFALQASKNDLCKKHIVKDQKPYSHRWL